MAFFRRGLVALQSILLCGLALLLAMQSVAHAASAPAVTNVRIGTFEGFTRVVLQTNAPLNPRLFTLDGPDRLVIDLPEIEWRINAPKGKIDSRLIKSFRFGLFEPGVSRLVLALNGPARVDRFDQRVLDGGRSFEFDVRLDELGVDAVPLDTLPPGAEARFASTADQARRLPQAPLVDRETREQFGSAAFDRERADFGALGNLLDALGGKKPAGEERAAIETPSPGADKQDTPAEPQLLASLGGAGIAIKPAEPPKHVGKPIRIMLDPGHGGYDPGTAPAGIGVTEKEINLLFSLELKKLLDDDPAFEVFMTRSDDTFVSLPDRVSKAQNQHADLLISIHADWFHDPAIKGATAYTLSEEASIRTTDRIVSDRGVDRTVAGIHLNEEREDVVRVLLDLARRETQTRSRSFGELVVEELEEVTPVVRGVRNHDLHVLRTADLPAVLIELGFVSNEEDRALLQSPEWRKKTANAVKNALDRWRIERGMREFAHR